MANGIVIIYEMYGVQLPVQNGTTEWQNYSVRSASNAYEYRCPYFIVFGTRVPVPTLSVGCSFLYTGCVKPDGMMEWPMEQQLTSV